MPLVHGLMFKYLVRASPVGTGPAIGWLATPGLVRPRKLSSHPPWGVLGSAAPGNPGAGPVPPSFYSKSSLAWTPYTLPLGEARVDKLEFITHIRQIFRSVPAL